jgi:hypothetical protein
MARGHSLEKLYPIFIQAATPLESIIIPPSPTGSGNTLYIHWTHHPSGLQRSDILQPNLTTLRHT